MKCPVCKTELFSVEKACEVCGFNDIRVGFINADEAVCWLDQTVLPYREKWGQQKRSVSASALYAEMVSRQMLQTKVTISVSSEFEYEIKDNTVTLTKYNAARETVKIPDYIEGAPVVAIGDRLFYGCKELTEIHLPETVVRIGKEAFWKSGLRKIDLPSKCCTIGSGAFAHTAIEEIVFPALVKRIELHTCLYCHSLKTIVIMGADTIDNGAFSWCQALKEVVFPDEMDYIGSAFSRSGPEYLLLPAKLKRFCLSVPDTGDYYRSFRHVAFLDSSTDIMCQYSDDKNGHVFYCKNGSRAQQYARVCEIPYKALEEFSIV